VKKTKFRLFVSAAVTILLGILGLEIISGTGFNLIGKVYTLLIHPIGATRIGQTVAYYAQPYLDSFISQVSSPLFYIFLLGSALVCIEMIKKVKILKHRIYLGILEIAAVMGILFSRYSSGSVLDGVNFLSQVIYFLGFAILISCLLWIYYKDRHKIDESILFLFSWMIIMLITVRAAQRTIFIVVTFIVIVGAYFIVRAGELIGKLKGKDIRYVIGILFILSLILSFGYLFGNPFTGSSGAVSTSYAQAQQTGPLMNDQWQNAMAWVRNDTPQDAVFLHWWDYGYILQTVGLRTTVLDGGNFNSYWDHLMGRYVLTTPNPDTALSFMKSHNVSYLLIDFSDLGKYSAYSIIGSDSSGIDRYASPPTLESDSTKDYQTANGTMRIYQGSTFVDQDISYNGLFLPGPSSEDGQVSTYNSYFVGIAMQYKNANSSAIVIEQPSGIFQYNGQQYVVPLRYVYYNGHIIDYNNGINATFMIIPSISSGQNGGISIDPLGGGIYLSPKVQESLFAQLYLMNDPYHQYSTLSKGDFEDNYIINSLKTQNANVGEFALYQGQLLAPLKIWKVDYPSNIKFNAEFLKPSGTYGDLDNLTFTQ
ncbi:MAG TPA: hypothetical protein VMC07_00510, partial [Candidatus Omnitrophota bacterium]|nr:hypothetical protein [Candidatus Omnitrophota bacterium]